MKNLFFYIVPLLVLFTHSSCKKDKVPLPPEPTKWEIITGDYKVYDTVGHYLYDMNISHIQDSTNNKDSLHFENFDGQFSFTQKQPINASNPEFYIQIGNQDLLLDANENRWKILFSFDGIYDNVLRNDTIFMNFIKTNFNYYIEDLVPYSYCDCKQVAVKQH